VLLQGHDDDITCLALHLSRSLVATGQVASALDGTANCPFLHVWDTTTSPPASVQQIDFPAGKSGVLELRLTGASGCHGIVLIQALCSCLQHIDLLQITLHHGALIATERSNCHSMQH
jgi:hypothetical protein